MPSNHCGAHRRLLATHDDDPQAGIANLFDVAMVFAVAFLVAFLARPPLTAKDHANLASSSQQDKEIVERDARKLKHYRISQETLQGTGERLGIAYRLENGEVVYVPNSD